MRIGLSCTTIDPAVSNGQIDGIGTYTKNLLDKFSEHAVLPYSFPRAREKNDMTSHLPAGKLFHYSYGASTLISLVNPTSFSVYGPLHQQIDIFHATDHMIPKLSSIPVVATLHDALMFKQPEWYRSRFSALKNTLRKKTVRWANHFITISQAMVTELVEHCGIDEQKISVIYNGISPWWHESLSDVEKQNTLDRLQLPKNFLLFASTLQPKKNLPRLIQAFLALPRDIQAHYPLIIVGREGIQAEESLRWIEQLQQAGVGRWLNYVTQAELKCLLQSATLYLHPSLHEGFGLTLLEAFASGVAVLTSNVAAIPEVVGDAAHLVDPYSVSEISDGIYKLLTSAGLKEEFVKRGEERVKAFSWERCAEETFGVYLRVLS